MSRTLAIVGAGFSGTLLAIQALRRVPAGTSIVLLERVGEFGPGLAYATANPNHLLNVPAARMTAFPDQPSDFVDWLQSHPKWQSADSPGFVPRQAYGAYLRHALQTELRRPEIQGRLTMMRGNVQSIVPAGSALRLHLDGDRALTADLAVLAIGNFPPAAPRIADPSFYDSPFYHADPWRPDALDGLEQTEPVFLIGTGLTAIDTILSLLDRGHTGPITAMSRRGLLPRTHVPPTALLPRPLPPLPSNPVGLLAALRREAEDAASRGSNWQAAVDSIRPFTQDLWQSMPTLGRKAFLRHLRPWWDVHRHRLAPQLADRIAAARAAFQLRVRRGRIETYEAVGSDRVEVGFRIHPRDGGGEGHLLAARVINCSGPSYDYARTDDPLLRSLLDTGMARPDTLHLGLDVTGTCALRDGEGGISRQIFGIGPLTRGMFWEMTAVPDLRRQAVNLATHLAGLLAALPTRVSLATSTL
ncbi:FAD/NAD(P)-binding protein [Acidisphaera sp. L21]|uniref:FAD/NAD(P)-binding protein n=1 Tax=Acidisphaera sp. L21 TaxID=1641851 RepID=UPI00131D6F74|nr:FAD/NAD(P)-binding protein [Acidisphaera sp. L21]